MKHQLYWLPATFLAWGTSGEERIPFIGTLKECVEEAKSQCDGVSFLTINRRMHILVNGIYAGDITLV